MMRGRILPPPGRSEGWAGQPAAKCESEAMGCWALIRLPRAPSHSALILHVRPINPGFSADSAAPPRSDFGFLCARSAEAGLFCRVGLPLSGVQACPTCYSLVLINSARGRVCERSDPLPGALRAPDLIGLSLCP